MNKNKQIKRFMLLAVILLETTISMAQTCDSIPFLYHGHLIVRSTINDSIDSNIVFDTGAANLFGVDSVFLINSRWKPQNTGKAITGGGAGRVKVKTIEGWTKVTIGSIVENYWIVPVFKLRDVVDCHVDGICGIRSITDYPFEINFEHHYLKRHKEGLPNIDGYIKLPIQYKDYRIMLQAETIIQSDSIKGWYLMDTGGDGTIDFTAQAVKQFQLDSIPGKRYITDMTQFGIGEKEQEYFVDMLSDQIIIGGDTINKEYISYIPEGAGAFSSRPYIGVIGNGIWENYNIIIDIKNRSLYLHRFKETSVNEPTYDYGFRNRTDICCGWVVSWLTRNGDAVRAGMELGDTIVAVNGKDVRAYTWDEEDNINKTPKHTLDIISSNGIKKSLSLEARKRW